MTPEPKYCSQCGERYTETSAWPKVCAGCRHEEYGNPKPVAVVLCGFGEHVLLVRRHINPGKGLLACPGGYQNRGEAPDEAASRELLEETSMCDISTGEVVFPGLEIPPAWLKVFDNKGVAHLNLTLSFYCVPASFDKKVRDWWNAAASFVMQREDDLWNREVRRIELVHFRDIGKSDIAFTSHRAMLTRWSRSF